MFVGVLGRPDVEGRAALLGPVHSELAVVITSVGGVDSVRRPARAKSAGASWAVVALHGFGRSADMAFDLGLPSSVEPTRQALVSVDGGNGYWHARHAHGVVDGRVRRPARRQ